MTAVASRARVKMAAATTTISGSAGPKVMVVRLEKLFSMVPMTPTLAVADAVIAVMVTPTTRATMSPMRNTANLFITSSFCAYLKAFCGKIPFQTYIWFLNLIFSILLYKTLSTPSFDEAKPLCG